MKVSSRAATGAALAASAALLAACSAHSVQTTGDAPGGTAPAKQAAAKTAGIGSAITLSGNDSGEQVKVTVVKVVTDPKGADEFTTPDTGKRFYAVQFRLNDTGSKAYSDSPSNGAQVTDSSGQSYESDISDVTGCESFPATVNIAPGGTGLGCVTFQVTKDAKVTGVQFTLDSGMGPDTGQWKVSK